MRRTYFLAVLALVALVLPGVQAWSQVSSYTFTAGNGTPTDMTGSTVLIGNGVDDAASSATSIGFTFRFNGVDYTDFVASSNGTMYLGSFGSSNFNNADFGTASGVHPVIAPFWDDKTTMGTGAQVDYILSGSSPNQILTVQWNVTRSGQDTAEYFTYQARLFEGSNAIEMVYVSMSPNVPTDATIGIAADTADYSSITPGTSATASNTSVDSAVDASATPIGANTVYSFSPVCPSIDSAPEATAYCPGATAAFSVTVSGTGPFSYQWRKDNNDINGATGATYSIASVGTSDTGFYDVVVMGACSSSVSTTPAELLINDTTSITSQPAGMTVCAGNDATFSVEAAGSGTLAY